MLSRSAGAERGHGKDDRHRDAEDQAVDGEREDGEQRARADAGQRARDGTRLTESLNRITPAR